MTWHDSIIWILILANNHSSMSLGGCYFWNMLKWTTSVSEFRIRIHCTQLENHQVLGIDQQPVPVFNHLCWRELVGRSYLCSWLSTVGSCLILTANKCMALLVLLYYKSYLKPPFKIEKKLKVSSNNIALKMNFWIVLGNESGLHHVYNIFSRLTVSHSKIFSTFILLLI